tara:strand:- start:208 stop:852 length:645 start_codon:yes stop_codon:yes gene_type:complete
MTSKKKILWESWNAKILASEEQPEPQQEEPSYEMPEVEVSPDFFIPVQSRLIYTPMGAYPEESMLKPSDRWDCWIAHTSFPITGSIANILNTDIDGIEVLKIMGKYSFFIGVAQLFDIRDVRKQINEKICSYTENEIFSNDDIQETVDLLKDQLKDNKYWSILVCPEGRVEYVVANEINAEYLDALSSLIDKKNNFGGIILRSDNGQQNEAAFE